jgi:hypothetical protein
MTATAIATATATPTASPTPVGPPTLKMTPRRLDFGKVDYAVAGAASRVKKLKIDNPAKYNATVIITSIVGTAGFTADPSCQNASLAAGKRLVGCNS